MTYYILHDEYSIITTEDLNMATEYLTTGMKLYGYAEDQIKKDILVYECFKTTT
jgi:hypothetical protein